MALYGDRDPAKQKSCDNVDSSAISSINYDSSQRELNVTFHSGRTYTYVGVSPQRYSAFCDAGSKGRYFNSAIKNKYGWFRRP